MGIAALRQPTPSKGTGLTKLSFTASLKLVKDVFKNLTGFSNPIHILPQLSTHKRKDWGCPSCGSLDHYFSECQSPPTNKKAAADLLIGLGKQSQNTGALATANTTAAKFEEAVRTIYN